MPVRTRKLPLLNCSLHQFLITICEVVLTHYTKIALFVVLNGKRKARLAIAKHALHMITLVAKAAICCDKFTESFFAFAVRNERHPEWRKGLLAHVALGGLGLGGGGLGGLGHLCVFMCVFVWRCEIYDKDQGFFFFIFFTTQQLAILMSVSRTRTIHPVPFCLP